MSTGFGYTFPAIKGIQSGKEYYVSMCPLKLIPKIFSYNEEEVPAVMRSQRVLNSSRIPEMAKYITSNKTSYIFSALTASIDSEIEFEPYGDSQHKDKLGLLHIPLEAKFIINDGQHRRAAIEQALKEKPELGDETISVVFFLDIGLKRSQQMFADLNRYAIRPSKSLGILYDNRDPKAMITKDIILSLSFLVELTEMEKTSLTKRSKKLFTLSAFHGATNDLLKGLDMEKEKKIELGKEFWSEIYYQFNDWQQVRNSQLLASNIRQEYLHSHGIILSSLGKVGNSIINQKNWKSKLSNLKNIDWLKTNKVWNGRALINGKASKSDISIALTTNYIKQELNIPLTKEEQEKENEFKERGQNV